MVRTSTHHPNRHTGKVAMERCQSLWAPSHVLHEVQAVLLFQALSYCVTISRDLITLTTFAVTLVTYLYASIFTIYFLATAPKIVNVIPIEHDLLQQ